MTRCARSHSVVCRACVCAQHRSFRCSGFRRALLQDGVLHGKIPPPYFSMHPRRETRCSHGLSEPTDFRCSSARCLLIPSPICPMISSPRSTEHRWGLVSKRESHFSTPEVAAFAWSLPETMKFDGVQKADPSAPTRTVFANTAFRASEDGFRNTARRMAPRTAEELGRRSIRRAPSAQERVLLRPVVEEALARASERCAELATVPLADLDVSSLERFIVRSTDPQPHCPKRPRPVLRL